MAAILFSLSMLREQTEDKDGFNDKMIISGYRNVYQI